MRHNIQAGQVAFDCPVCGAVVPMFRVEVTRYGFLGRRTAVVVDGDATDFVAHLWTHRHPGWDKTDKSSVT